MTTIVFIFLAIPLFLIEDFLIALGQPEKIANEASIYVKVCIPGVLFYSWQSCYARFLSGQRITVVPMYANISATIVHVIIAT